MLIQEKFEEVKLEFKMKMQEKGVCLHEIIGYYTDKLKHYMIFVFFKTEKELKSFSKEQLESFKSIYINILEEKEIIPNYVTRIVGFYFDSDENVQKNFHGNYWLATKWFLGKFTIK